MVVSQPMVPEPIPIRFPWPPYATNPDEAAVDEAARAVLTDRVTAHLAAQGGQFVEL
jgi:hypothetical protein